MDNVPHDEWLTLINRARSLEILAKHNPRLWQQLTPLNRYIRALGELPTTKDTWPTRIMRESRP